MMTLPVRKLMLIFWFVDEADAGFKQRHTAFWNLPLVGFLFDALEWSANDVAFIGACSIGFQFRRFGLRKLSTNDAKAKVGSPIVNHRSRPIREAVVNRAVCQISAFQKLLEFFDTSAATVSYNANSTRLWALRILY